MKQAFIAVAMCIEATIATSFSAASNCQYVTDLVNSVKSHGRVPGVYSNYYMWESIMGAAGSCTGLGGVPMWYAHYDGVASLSD